MKPIARHVLAIIAGLVVILIGQFLADALGLWLYPLPPGIEMGVTPLGEILASRPRSAVVLYNLLRLPIVVLGGVTIAKIVPARPVPDVLIAVGIYVLLSLWAVFLGGSSFWMVLWVVVMFPVCGLAGARLTAGSHGPLTG